MEERLGKKKEKVWRVRQWKRIKVGRKESKKERK